MTSLAALQRDFLASLDAEACLADERTEVYRRNRLANAHAALAATYPVVLRLVGAAFFREASDRYARAHPSTSGDLGEYGAAFGDFLAGYPHAAALACLADVARLEWAVHESDRAADAAPLDAAALARVPAGTAGRVRLALHPAVRLVASSHPVRAIWEANQPGRDGTPDADAAGGTLCVRRTAQGAAPLALSDAEARLLGALASGASLDEACDALGDEATDTLAPALARLVGAGVFCGFCAP